MPPPPSVFDGRAMAQKRAARHSISGASAYARQAVVNRPSRLARGIRLAALAAWQAAPPSFAEVLCRCQPPDERIYAPSVWAQVWDKWRESGKQAVKSVVWLAIEADRASAISAEWPSRHRPAEPSRQGRE